MSVLNQDVSVNTPILAIAQNGTAEYDAGTPAGQVPTITFNDALVSVLSNFTTQNGAHTIINGPVVSILSNEYIGSGSTLTINSAIGISVDSGVYFLGPNSTIEFGQAAASGGPANDFGHTLYGFQASDQVTFDGVSGATHVDVVPNLVQALTNSSTVNLLNASNQTVGSFSLIGNDPAARQFAITTTGGNTTLTFHA